MNIDMVRCIQTLVMDAGSRQEFTRGNLYEVVSRDADGVHLRNNSGDSHCMWDDSADKYWSEYFVELEPIDRTSVQEMEKRYGYVRVFAEETPEEGPVLCEAGVLHETPAEAATSMRDCFALYGKENYRLAVIAWVK